MTNEDKELLLKDMSARLPYGVKCSFDNKVFSIDYISAIYDEIKLDSCDDYTLIISDVKPYLFPLSNMTEEQRKEYHELLYNPKHGINIDYFDWCHKNHLDCRGLIPKGLANDATGLDIY